MTDSHQLAEDLQFVRQAVEARDKPKRPPVAPVAVWAVYCLICIPCFDFIPQYGGRINLAGMVITGVISFLLGKRHSAMTGQYDRGAIARSLVHFYGGVVLLLLATFGLAWVNPGMNETLIGQISVVLVGFMYFFGGVHMPDVRFMCWAGPIIMLAGVGMAEVPHYRWTAMGLIYGLCLLSPLVFSKRVAQQP